jgi:hypothetical protein
MRMISRSVKHFFISGDKLASAYASACLLHWPHAGRRIAAAVAAPPNQRQAVRRHSVTASLGEAVGYGGGPPGRT